jgi:hypothetical protein
MIFWLGGYIFRARIALGRGLAEPDSDQPRRVSEPNAGQIRGAAEPECLKVAAMPPKTKPLGLFGTLCPGRARNTEFTSWFLNVGAPFGVCALLMLRSVHNSTGYISFMFRYHQVQGGY